MRSDFVLLCGEDGGEVGRFYPDKLKKAAIYLCAAGWCFLVAVRRAKLKTSKRKTTPYIIKTTDYDDAQFLFVGLFVAVSPLLWFSFFSFWGAVVDVRLAS